MQLIKPSELLFLKTENVIEPYIENIDLTQDIFHWFRENLKLSSHVDLKSINHLSENYYYKIVNFSDFIDDSTTLIVEGFKSYEEAEYACFKKLIELSS